PRTHRHLHSFPTRRSSDLGMRPGGGFARRFIAGETVEEAIAACRAIAAAGMTTTLDYLGESVASIAEAAAATRAYLAVLDAIARSEEHTSELQSLAYLVCR